MIWNNGRKKDGYWKNGKLHGKGTQIYSNGDVYEGNFKDGSWDGYGIYIWADGSSYKGDWKTINLTEEKDLDRWNKL